MKTSRRSEGNGRMDKCPLLPLDSVRNGLHVQVGALRSVGKSMLDCLAPFLVSSPFVPTNICGFLGNTVILILLFLFLNYSLDTLNHLLQIFEF